MFLHGHLRSERARMRRTIRLNSQRTCGTFAWQSGGVRVTDGIERPRPWPELA
jgi:hypothetical protein